MAEIISIANNKGGVGKTTTVVALGHAWASQQRTIFKMNNSIGYNIFC